MEGLLPVSPDFPRRRKRATEDAAFCGAKPTETTEVAIPVLQEVRQLGHGVESKHERGRFSLLILKSCSTILTFVR